MCKKTTMGYIKLFRKIQDWGWYDDPNMLALWVHLLLDACWKDDAEWHGEAIPKGSLITSVANLSAESGLSIKQVRLCLDRLVKSGEIVREGANKWTKITICNYATYQDTTDTEGQTKGEQRANKGQTEGKQRATSKESKNISIEEGNIEKKLSNDSKEKRFVPPSVEEVQEYANSIGFNLDAGYFVDFYAANGWKQKGGQKLSDWKAAVRNWQRMDAKREQTTLFAPADDWHDETRVYFKQDFIDNKKMQEYFALDGVIQDRLNNGYSVVWRNGKFVLQY